MITNKHVIEKTLTGKITFHLTLPDREEPTPALDSKAVFFKDWSSKWFFHPDPDIDLACMPLSEVSQQFVQAGLKSFSVTFGPQHIPNFEQVGKLSSIEDILMVGYPIGLWDEVNNRPIIRRGITATSIKADFNGRPEFVCDIACFPGSSGSPIVLVRDRVHFLLGVLYAGPVFDVKGNIIVEDIPTEVKGETTTKLMIHLGYAIKSIVLSSLMDGLMCAAQDPDDIRFNFDI